MIRHKSVFSCKPVLPVISKLGSKRSTPFHHLRVVGTLWKICLQIQGKVVGLEDPSNLQEALKVQAIKRLMSLRQDQALNLEDHQALLKIRQVVVKVDHQLKMEDILKVITEVEILMEEEEVKKEMSRTSIERIKGQLMNC